MTIENYLEVSCQLYSFTHFIADSSDPVSYINTFIKLANISCLETLRVNLNINLTRAVTVCNSHASNKHFSSLPETLCFLGLSTLCSLIKRGMTVWQLMRHKSLHVRYRVE